MPKQSDLKYIDLFAGCGGLSEGFEACGGFQGVAHVEWDEAACRTLRTRLEKRWRYANAAQMVIRDDLQDFDSIASGRGGQFGEHAGLDRLVADASGVDLVIGGPPCQAYSIAGRIRDENGMNDDYRNYLFEAYLRVVRRYTPKFVVFENVPGMLSAKPGGVDIASRVRSAFREAGYFVSPNLRDCLVEMSQFGVPQTRQRVIIVAGALSIPNIADAIERFYRETLPKRRGAARTVGDAIGDLPCLVPLRTPIRQSARNLSHEPFVTAIPDHSPRFHSKRDQRIFAKLARDRMSPKQRFRSVEALRALYTRETGRDSAVHKYHVLDPDKPSNLIPAHLHKDGLRHIHFDPNQARSITIREAARLQGFPDDYLFCGTQGDKYKMIGNAVPPAFSIHLADAIRELIRSGDTGVREIPRHCSPGRRKAPVR